MKDTSSIYMEETGQPYTKLSPEGIYYTTDYVEWLEQKLTNQAKNNDALDLVSKSIAEQYAVFCVICERKGKPLLNIEDYIKQYVC